ncbi:SDR family oxidoreductase [Maritalea myrionectae]|uniref:SDR family oxidoreductase n=1 Tax=Maritalea myrionectae TaxID=454601 RepID=UPI0004070256|nr:SDR family oxidoreductase [Maritalea myrionectae]
MSKILITGASGQLGSLVIKHLLETENIAAGDIVAGSRDPSKLSDLAELGVETRAIDFDQSETLDAGFADIDRLLIISTDVLDVPGKRLAQHKAAISAAIAANVSRIFYTSMPRPDDSAISFAPDHAGSEQAIRESGLAYTILRDSWYMENLFMTLPQTIASGQWFTSAAEGATAYIAREDCARGIAAALVKQDDNNALYTLTGSKAFSNPEIASLASAATGKPIDIIALDDEALAKGLTQAGVPEGLIPFLISVEKATRAGHLADVTSDFEHLTGRQPVAFEDFINNNATALRGA